MNLFLQAAYKVIDVPIHSCYEIFKDFIVPIFGSALGVFGAYYVMNKQLKKSNKKEQEDESRQKKIELEMMKVNNKKIIGNNKYAIEELGKLIRYANLKSFHKMSINQFNSTFHLATRDLGYQRVFEFIDVKSDYEVNLFAKYWSAISSIPKTYVDLKEYLLYIHSEHNKINECINDLTNSLAIEIRKNIHKALEFGDILELKPEEIESHPVLKLAHMSRAVELNLENNAKMDHFSKIENFLNDINKIGMNPMASKIKNPELFQNVQTALGHLESIQKIQIACKTTLKHYKTIYLEYGTVLIEFDSLLSKRTL